MKLTYKLFILITVILVACGKPSNQNNEEGSGEGEEGNPNQVLYDQVMDIHDEVMPKMNDIYKIKSQIMEKIANSPDLVLDRKEMLEKLVLQLDSASNAMMDWMHQFQPVSDSIDQEQARAYLESQMEKIKKVKEEMLITIERAKEEAGQN